MGSAISRLEIFRLKKMELFLPVNTGNRIKAV